MMLYSCVWMSFGPTSERHHTKQFQDGKVEEQWSVERVILICLSFLCLSVGSWMEGLAMAIYLRLGTAKVGTVAEGMGMGMGMDMGVLGYGKGYGDGDGEGNGSGYG